MLSESFVIPVFAGLMLEDDTISVLSFHGKKIKDQLNDITSGPVSAKIASVNSYYYQVLDDIRVLGGLHDAIKEKKGKENELKFEDYFPYTRATLDLIEHACDICDFAGSQKICSLRTTCVPIIEDVLNIWQGIASKEYALALVNTMDILDKCLADTNSVRKIVKYGSFMVNVMTAENEDQVANALRQRHCPRQFSP
jgi:hypothetical protein